MHVCLNRDTHLNCASKLFELSSSLRSSFSFVSLPFNIYFSIHSNTLACTIIALNLIAIKARCTNGKKSKEYDDSEYNSNFSLKTSQIQCIAIFPNAWKKLAPNTTAIVYGGPKKSRGTTCNYNHENRSQECAHSNVKFLVLCVWQWQFKTGSKL